MSDGDAAQPKPRRKRKQTMAQTMGGVIFGFEQQVWRTAPPPQELVHHARPDAPVAPPGPSSIALPPPLGSPGSPGSPAAATHDEEPKR